MSKFVRIKEVGTSIETFMLNLDLVATVKLTNVQSIAQLAGDAPKPGRAHLILESADRLILANFYLDTVEEGRNWVLQHLGIAL